MLQAQTNARARSTTLFKSALLVAALVCSSSLGQHQPERLAAPPTGQYPVAQTSYSTPVPPAESFQPDVYSSPQAYPAAPTYRVAGNTDPNGDLPRPEQVAMPPNPGPVAPASEYGAEAPIVDHDVRQGWWVDHIANPLRHSSNPKPVSIHDLLMRAMQYSSRIRVISDSPLIQDTGIIEADADFDWVQFMEAAWNDVDEPVGSTLTTGGPPRFSNEKATFDAGIRRRTTRGGQFEAKQVFGYERSNSVFFIPNDQGTSRLTLNYTQPLLRGAGRVVNTSSVILAQLQSDVARAEFSRELQGHLLDITQSYWTLFLERGALLQRERLYKRGELILRDLETRGQMDAVANQIVRARSAVSSRKADLYRAAASVKNAEARIRALVNAPDLGQIDEFELTPTDFPTSLFVPLQLPEAIQIAFQNRPEVSEAVQLIKAAAVRSNVAKNDLLPILDLVAETYVSGLRDTSAFIAAAGDQFSDGAPSYSTGLRFELPLGNRAARARFTRRALEYRQFQNQFQNTLQSLQLEVEVSVREMITSHREIEAKYEAMKAAEGEVEFLTDRWQLLPGDDRAPGLLLEDLLAAQERLAVEEFEFLNAQIQYNISLVTLRQAMGTLLQFENVSVASVETDRIPALQLHKGYSMDNGMPGVAPTFAPPVDRSSHRSSSFHTGSGNPQSTASLIDSNTGIIPGNVSY